MLKLPRIFAGLLVFVGAGVGVAHADDAVNASVMAAMAQPTGHIATTKYVRSITDSLNDTVLGTVNKDGEREGGLTQQVTAAAQAAAGAKSAADSAQATADSAIELIGSYGSEGGPGTGILGEIQKNTNAIYEASEEAGHALAGVNTNLNLMGAGYTTDEDGNDVITNLNTDAKIIVPAINELDAEIEGTINAETGEREGGLKQQVQANTDAIGDVSQIELATGGYSSLISGIGSIRGMASSAQETADQAKYYADMNIDLMGAISTTDEDGNDVITNLDTDAKTLVPAINELDAEIEGAINAETGEREGGLKKQVQANTDAIQANWGQVPIKQGGVQTGTVQIWVE